MLVKCRTHDQEVASGRSGGIIFSPGLTLCAVFDVHFISMLPQWHVKDPSHFAKSAGGRLHLNTHTPLTQQSQSGLTVPLSRRSVGTYLEMSSHATHHGILGHSYLSLLNHCGLSLAQRAELVCAS